MGSPSEGAGCGPFWFVMLWMASIQASDLVLTDRISAHICFTLCCASDGSFPYARLHSCSSTDEPVYLPARAHEFGSGVCGIFCEQEYW